MRPECCGVLLERCTGLYAHWRRDRGRYDRQTLRAYWVAWRSSASVAALLRLAAFRRDLGRPLPQRWVAPLRAGCPALPPNARRLAFGLLAEVAPVHLSVLPSSDRIDAAARIPALAAQCLDTAPTPLAQLHTEQADRRQGFAQWLTQRRQANGLCVVGNAATLRGRGLGALIDAHGAVLRFNAFKGDVDATDLGTRIDVWVAKGDYRGSRPTGQTWAVHSGPDPRFRVIDLETLALLVGEGTPVLTAPLTIWRALVIQLEAPPTAGVLMLAWLRTLLGGWTGVRCAGIGSGLGTDGRYHAAIAGKPPGRRHAWSREQALVERWRTEGLQCLDHA